MKLTLLTWLLLLLVLKVTGGEDSTVTVRKGTLDRIEQLLDRTGVSIGGQMSTGRYSAKIRGDGVKKNGRSTEADEYTTLDLAIRANVNKSLQGKAVLRLHHNWQNFWSDPGNPLFTRWLSIDGNLGGRVDFHAGDCMVRHSPLTIWMPQFEMLYEPTTARRMRIKTMDEFFLGENRRPLEGVNAVADLPVGLFVEQVTLSGTGSRLRSAYGAPVNGSPAVAGSEARPNFSKYLAAMKGGVRMRGGLQLGAEHLYIFDNVNETRIDEPRIKSTAQYTTVNDISAEWDVTRLLGESVRKLRLFAEAALSVDDSGWYDNGSTGIKRLTASAAYGGVAFEFDFPLNITSSGYVKYIRNEESFRNELAQSPAFAGRRIMNSEADSTNGWWIAPNHYSTFDARYHSVFKFSPSERSNMWHKAPFSKISYGSNVYTKEEMEYIAGRQLDPALQLLMPFGDATPDRQGVRMDLTSRWNEYFEVTLLLSWLEGEKFTGWGYPTDGHRTLKEYGGGMLFDMSGYASWLRYPLLFSCSRMVKSIGNAQYGVTTTVENVDVLWQTGRYLELSAGLQQIISGYDNSRDIKQTWMAGGCSLLFTPNVALRISLSRIMVDKYAYSFAITPFRYTEGEFRQLLSEVVFEASF